MPNLNPLEVEQQGQDKGGTHLCELRAQQQLAPVDSVCDDSSHQGKEDDGKLSQKRG